MKLEEIAKRVLQRLAFSFCVWFVWIAAFLGAWILYVRLLEQPQRLA
jgi:hypothetical protein